MIIREAEPHEMELVHRVMKQAFAEYAGRLMPESGALRESFEDIIRKTAGCGGAILVWNGQEPIGSAQYVRKDNYLYIGRVAVLPNWRGRGIGKGMLEALEEMAIAAGLRETQVGVRLSIPENVEFYRRMRYVEMEHLFYPDRTDSWYVMRKRVGEDAT